MLITRARGKIAYADSYHLPARTALQLCCVTINQLVLASQSQTHEKICMQEPAKASWRDCREEHQTLASRRRGLQNTRSRQHLKRVLAQLQPVRAKFSTRGRGVLIPHVRHQPPASSSGVLYPSCHPIFSQGISNFFKSTALVGQNNHFKECTVSQ